MRLLTVWLCLLTLSNVGAASPANMIKVTLLGTGTPFPNAARFGAAILVEAGGEKLLFDCGRGAVIRLSQAGVPLDSVDALFLTHLHSDHVVGIPDLWLTGWFLGRDHPLRVWGPPGTREMTEHLSLAYQFDVQTREHTENLPPKGAGIDAKEIEQGDVYVHGPLRVSVFLVDHGSVKPAFGYRIDYFGHAVIISGDTKFSQNLIDFSKGADCLIHVAWLADSKNPLRSLASGEDAGRVFAAVKPKLAVIYHYKDEEGLAEAVRARYQGPFVIAQDLMTIEIDRETTWHPGTPDLLKNAH
jgi:ribonuclease Z